MNSEQPDTSWTVPDRLAAAAMSAAQAPSIHNTQPWQWRINGRTAELHLEASRHLHVVDPDRRLATVSCGVALHHAQVALAATGTGADTQLLPRPENPLYLAKITATDSTPAIADAGRLREAIDIRHTDRRPLKDQSIPVSVVSRLQAVAANHLSGLHPLSRAQVLELAAAIARAQTDETGDVATHHELDSWTGVDSHGGVGIPDANIPAGPTRTTVPTRDFGHVGTLPVNDEHDYSATYAILWGYADDPRAWLHAGQALSDIWLHATDLGLALLPLSAAVEAPYTRQKVNHLLEGIGYAQIAMRLGIPDPTQGDAPRTPRLRPSEVVTIDP